MTDGHILLINETLETAQQMQLQGVGGIWSLCAFNNDADLAFGALGGVYIAEVLNDEISQTEEIYLKSKKNNLLVATSWVTPHVYLINRNTE